MSLGPTILVKKSDGTTVKMTMSEFKVYKESKREVKPEEKKERCVIHDNEKVDND